mmetsp:Transcript_98450/g.301151  ORF Transcript_98450/g.301151 Transcript_98450/m.301151 type:complete len:301 (+) Transcript_98450:1215-2117(+)
MAFQALLDFRGSLHVGRAVLGRDHLRLLGIVKRRHSDLLLGPPLKRRGHFVALVLHLETFRQLLLHRQALVDLVRSALRQLEALNQLAAALLDASVRALLPDLRLEIGVHLLHIALRGGPDGGKERVVQRFFGGEAFLLFPLQGLQHELFTLFPTTRWALDSLAEHVILSLEGEPPGDHTEDHHAKRPDVHLQAVVQGVELRPPIGLRAAPRLHPRPRLHLRDCAKIAEVDAACRVFDLPAVLQIVVAFQVTVDAVVRMQPVDALEHHLRHVLARRDRDHALQFPMVLHALDHVAAAVDL